MGNKSIAALVILCLGAVVIACEKADRNAVGLTVDYTWEGLQPCKWGNPEIHVGGIPPTTKFLVISMFDHAYKHDHGTVKMPYTGSGQIERDRFKEIQGPCPSWTPGRYEITIKAVDEKDAVLGIGSKERPFPENS